MTAIPSSQPDAHPRESRSRLRGRISPTRTSFAGLSRPVTASEAVLDELADFVDIAGPATHVVATNEIDDLHRLIEGRADAIVNLWRINDVRRLNKFFEALHGKLADDGVLVVCVETLAHWRARVQRRLPPVLSHIHMALVFVLKRVLPKLRLTRSLYFRVTKGRNRLLSRAETMGRLYCCGFDVIGLKRIDHLLFLVTRKRRPPTFDMEPSYGPIFRMRRVGKNGQPIHVYKLRTMHPYAEYLQQYVYANNALADGGKFTNDFRVTPWGRSLRRFWIDELPMLVNWFKGEMKLVGVRPLSFHFESLYPADVRECRRRTKPGLIPPFYADMPKSLDEIVESERRYLAAYDQSPMATDFRYLILAVRNIVLRGARSH